MPAIFEHGYALLIGVGDCAYTKWSLPATVKDAEAIQRVLQDPNLCAYPKKNLHLLKDKAASRKGILDELAWLKGCAEADPEATVVIFYSGHGWVDKTSGGYYLIPSDTSPLRPAKSALSAADLTTALQAILAKRLLVVLDSCHAAGMATAAKDAGEEQESDLPEDFASGAMPKALSEELAQGQGRAVFTSSSGDELSWVRKDGSMSIYTFHLTEALEGAGNREGDNKVNLSDLMGYVSRAVPETVRKECGEAQTPNFDFKTEDFPVALLRGGKGLPRGGWNEVLRQKEAAAQITNVQAIGDRSVAIGGQAHHSTIITSDNNIVGDGNIRTGNITGSSGIAIG
ncbi:MAG TPA: caspase family protein, partial [Anaerolineaceae bacterium]|nr:caspase family protein [Anaerolineaceae bacterium]